MARMKRAKRRSLAVMVWASGLLLFMALGLWNLRGAQNDAESRVINEAGRVAAQLAGLLNYRGVMPNAGSANAIVRAAMDDDRVYAVKVEAHDHILAAQRRNYMWEPVPWDDEIAEDCVQGINPLRVNGKTVGKVEVWVSSRSGNEEYGLLEQREKMRFFLCAILWTALLLLLLWYWGDLRRAINYSREKLEGSQAPSPEEIVSCLGREMSEKTGKAELPDSSLINAGAGRDYQRKNPDAWYVTAGLFRQTFLSAPNLLARLFADGETAALCHLGRMLELAALCLGATPLVEAARGMQIALNDPDCEEQALPVEECSRILEQTLAAIGGELCEHQIPATGGQ